MAEDENDIERATIQNHLLSLLLRLRHRGFAVAPDDYELLRQAVRAGFGWSSKQALKRVCVSLWAKSMQEQVTLSALFDELPIHEWNLEIANLPDGGGIGASATKNGASGSATAEKPLVEDKPMSEFEAAERQGILPTIAIRPDSLERSKRRFVFDTEFPVTYRETVQIWRRLRRPYRFGPCTEIDIEVTIRARVRSGIVQPPVLVAPRRNGARLLLLCDRKGSMSPFHTYCDAVISAIQKSGRLEGFGCYYFHDVPEGGTNGRLLRRLDPREAQPRMDSILEDIEPIDEGLLYEDKELMCPVDLNAVLRGIGPSTFVVILSDGGALRRTYDPARLLRTFAVLRAVRAITRSIVWINPVPAEDWTRCSAAEIGRHLPMSEMTRLGMSNAVSTLIGRPSPVERPLAWEK